MDWTTLKGLKEERGALVKKMENLLGKAEGEKRTLSEAEALEFGAWRTEGEKLRARIDNIDAVEALRGKEETRTERLFGGGDPNFGILPKDMRKYSLFRAVESAIKHGGKPDGFEGEVHDQMILHRKKVGDDMPVRGFLVPQGFGDGRGQGRREMRSLDTVTGGPGLVTTIVDFADFIDVLRARMVLSGLGARYLSNLVGLVKLPRLTTAATAAWVAEGAAPSATNEVTDQLTLTPHSISAFVDITRQTLKQTSSDPEMLVREDLAAVIARGWELAAINGSGSSGQPTGILNVSGLDVTTAIGTNGGLPTWASVIGLETLVGAANADFGTLGYLTNPKVRGIMKQTAKIGSTFPQYLWDNGPNPVNGYPVGVTTQVPSNLVKGSSGSVCSAFVFGNFNDLLMASWGALDVLVDPYSQSSTGNVRVRVFQEVDVEVRHVKSFAADVDYTT